MTVTPGYPHLQVLSAPACLTQSPLPAVPILITQIDSGAIAEKLIDHLRRQLTPDHPLTLISDRSDAAPETLDLSLGELAEQHWPAYPCSLYLSAPVEPPFAALQELINVVAQLRSPEGGCPWDLAQTPTSLTPYIIEEAYETVHAIHQGEQAAIVEELGDLLLQVVLQAQIASEHQQFSLKEVAQGISAKLIRRHPHVFADLPVADIDEVFRNWDQIKAAERGETPDQPQPLSAKLDRYVQTLPPLLASWKISEKSSKVGLDWPDLAGVWAKFYEELAEFQEALLQSDVNHQEAELGDLMFTLVTLARWCQLDPSAALQSTCRRFIERLQKIEARIEQPLEAYTLEQLEALWKQAKVELNQA